MAVVVSAPGDLTNRILALSQSAASGAVEQVRTDVAQLRHDVSTTFGVQESEVVDWMTQTLDTLEEYLTGVRILGECTPRMADELMSYGERFSAQWVAERLRREGIRAERWMHVRSFAQMIDLVMRRWSENRLLLRCRR